jgi:hypothetical protein
MEKLADCLANQREKLSESQTYGQNRANWERCTFRNEGYEYTNSYSLNDEGDFIFEFTKVGVEGMTDTYSRGKIDAYTCSRSTETFCVQIINDWPEKVSHDAQRFTGPNYFLHANSSIVNSSASSTNLTLRIQLSMSAKRYKSVPRSVYQIDIPDSLQTDVSLLRFFFDSASEVIYITGRKIARAYRIDQIKLTVKFIDFNTTTNDSIFRNNTNSPQYLQLNGTDLGKAFLKYMPKVAECMWTWFNITLGNTTVFHYIAWNNKSVEGNYFFVPKFSEALSVETKESEGKLEYQKVQVHVPMGTQKNIDIVDIVRGSFVGLESQKLEKTTQDLQNTYLDPYIYKFLLRKAKFLENIYMVDTEVGEKRKVYLVISTKFDNIVYHGNRVSPHLITQVPNNFTLRDFRQMTDFYPINPTEGLVQIQELIYIIKPFEENSSRESPSKGVNGVCSIGTSLSHDRLGNLHFCIHESKAYIRQLSADNRIQQLMPDYEAQDTLNSISYIKSIKKSDRYINHVFIFYFPKIDLTKDILFKSDDLVLAIMRIDHLSDPKLSLVSKHIMPYHRNSSKTLDEKQNVKFNVFVDLIALEVAGNKIINVEKANNETGEYRIGVTSLEKGHEPEFMYYVSIPPELSVEPSMKLIMTNLLDESDVEINQNTVLNFQVNSFQVCFKAKLVKTGENKVVVFNPDMPAFSSLSIIELPPEYSVIQFGPLFNVVKGSKTTSLAILASKGTITEEDYSKDTELYVFMVTDMTPTIQLKQFKSTSMITNYLDYNKVKEANTQIFTFNMTSEIYSSEKIEENRQKTETAKITIDDIQKRYEIKYQLWGNPYDAGIKSYQKVIDIAVEIKTDWYVGNLSETQKPKLEDLHEFFFRLDPLQYVEGHIFAYEGVAESNIEDFMGIVKVLDSSHESILNIDRTTKSDLKKFAERGSGRINLDWACDVEPTPQQISTFVHFNRTTVGLVNSCKDPNRLNVIASLDQMIYKINWDNMTSYTSNFSKTAKAYVTINEYVFYVERVYDSSESYVRLCRHNILTDDTRSASQNCMNSSGYYNIPHFDRREPKNFNELSLTLKVFPLKSIKDNRFIVCMMHYNKMMGIYTLVEIMDVNFHNQPGGNNLVIETMTLDFLASVYVSSDNLKLAFSASSKNYQSGVENSKSNVTIDLSLVYYRWRENTKLTLMNDVVTLNYAKDYSKTSPTDARLISPLQDINSEVQGFNTRVSGELNKFATLLYDLRDPGDTMRAIAESVQLITPKKMYNESFDDEFTWTSQRTGITRTEKQRIFRMLVNFPSSNSFLMHISVDYLHRVKLVKSKDTILNGYQLNLTQFKVLPIENPFIGFKPDADSPSPELIEEYFFMANNYNEKSYFIVYTLEIFKMQQYPYNVSHNYYDSNIFGLNISNRSMPLIFDNSSTNYLRTNALHELDFRPISMTVVPNCNITSHLEHRAFFVSTEEQVYTMNFTTFINVRIKTHKVASRKINVTITGKFGHNRTLVLKVDGSKTRSLWTQTFNFTLILVLVGISLVAGICMMIVIEKDVDLTQKENNKILSRFSVKPPKGQEEEKEEEKAIEEHSSASSDEDEEGEDLKKQLLPRNDRPGESKDENPLQMKVNNSKELDPLPIPV